MNLFNLTATLKLDKSDYEKGVNQVKTENSSLIDNFKTTATNIKSKIDLIVMAIGAIINVIKQVKALTVDYADGLGDLAAAYGVSNKAIQEFNYITSQSGSSVESLMSAMTLMYNKAKEGNNAFSKLGISIKDSNGNLKSMEDLFWEAQSAIAGMATESEQTAAMLDIFGKSAASVGETLRLTKEDMAALKEEASDYIISDKSIESAGRFNDELAKIKIGFQAVLSELVLGGEGAEEKFEAFMQELIDKFIEFLPTIVRIGMKLAVKLIEGISKILPELPKMFFDILESIDWLEIGINIAKALLNAIWEGLKNGLGKLIGYGWLWGKKDTSTTPENISANDITTSSEITNSTSSTSDINVNVNITGDTEIDKKNAEDLAEALTPYINRNLGRSV